MTARREYKYLFPETVLDALREMLLPYVDLDPHVPGNGRQYTVRTVYFDTPSLDFYHEKLAGLRERQKVRVRGYDDVTPTSPVFLEIKRNIGGAVIKQRAIVLYRDFHAFCETGDVRRYVRAAPDGDDPGVNAREFLFLLHARPLAPVITIVYDREPYFSRFERGVRITLDKHVRFHDDVSPVSLGRAVQERPALCRSFILEAKTDGAFPLWLGRILSPFHAIREAISKYVLCIDALRDPACPPDQMPQGLTSRAYSLTSLDR